MPKVTNILDIKRLTKAIWAREMSVYPAWKRFLILAARMIFAISKDLTTGQLSMRAMSLVYTTVISLVPLLALSFSVLKGFGVHNQLQPILLKVLEPLGQKGIEITEKIIEFVGNVQVGVLGTVGLGLLVYSVISMLQKIENSFNSIWQLSRGRSLAQKFSDYLSVVLIGPLLIFVSMGLTASFKTDLGADLILNASMFAGLVKLAGVILPYVLMAVSFTFIYIYIPNTKVKFTAALTGGLVTAVIWKLMGWVFAEFVTNASGNIAIYSAFASVLIFMFWLYLGWLVLLLGASVSYYQQNPEYTFIKQSQMKLSHSAKEKLGLTIMYYLVESFENDAPAWNLEGLSQKLNVPMYFVDEQIALLQKHGYVLANNETPTCYVPAKPAEKIKISELINLLRSNNAAGRDFYVNPIDAKAVDDIFSQYDSAINKLFSDTSIADIVKQKNNLN